MCKRASLLLAALVLLAVPLRAQGVLFDFDNAPLHASLPIDVTAGGITAHLSATGQGFSIQRADVLGWTPAGFGGYCLYPNSVFQADLLVSFSQTIQDISMMYAPEEYGCDDSAIMRITGYMDATFVATSTTTAPVPGTWPTGLLTLSAPSGFNRVVIHYDTPPLCTDRGPIFMADNMTVTPVGSPPSADLAVGKSDGQTMATPGLPITYTIVVSNAGPSPVTGAPVSDAVPAAILGATWTCAASPGAACTPAGAGNIDDLADLPVGATATYTLTGTVDAAATGLLANTAAVAVPAGINDPHPADNSATDTDVLGPPSSHYYTLQPCRVADTRNPPGPSGGPALAANTVRTFPMAGVCGIPAQATAVALNVTVVGETDTGDLRLFPAGVAPPLVSTINFAAGHVRANNAVILLGAAGAITVQCDMPPGSTGQTHVVFDTYGYFR